MTDAARRRRRRLRSLVLTGAVASTVIVAAPSTAVADDGSAFAPVLWVTYPTNDSVELGDHSLNLNFNFGSPNEVVSSAGHDFNGQDDGTGSGLTVLLRTSSDGATLKLPPSPASPALLGSPRVGLTPTSTIVEGRHAGLTLTFQAMKPFIPNDAVDSLDSMVSNAPFIYFRFQVTNDGASASDPAALYVGVNATCGGVMNDWPRTGWRAFSFCNGGDKGGKRYLALPADPSATWARGLGTVADFSADGRLSNTGTSGTGAFALSIPALATGETWSTTGVYAAWNTARAIAAADGTQYPFYYRGWWPDVASMVNFAIDQHAYAFDASRAFDATVSNVGSDGATQWAASHAFRGYRHGQWLMRKPDESPFYAVTEGGFGYLSTIDVAYDYHPFQTWYEPWKSELELREWSTHWEQDAAGNRFLLHDLGKGTVLTEGQAYDQKAGLRRHMPVEENVDAVAMILAWEASTGRTFDPGLVQLLLDSVESHDSDDNGSIDVGTMVACLPDGVTCRTSELGTTYDSGGMKPAAQRQQGNTILTVKMAVVESLAAARGYLPASGPDYATLAERHFTAVQPYIRRISSDASLSGATAKPGYVPEALLYAVLLGRNAVLDEVMPWLNDAMVANQNSVSGSCAATCITRYSTADKEVWIAKAVAGDVVSAWVAREWPSWTRLRRDAAKFLPTWANRTGGFTQGTFGRAQYPSNSFLGHNWYPRIASLWAVAPGFPSQPQPLGFLTGSVTGGGAPLPDARVSACPVTGTCVRGVTDDLGDFRLAVAPSVAATVSVEATGFETTYYPGTTDPAQATPVVVSPGQTIDLGTIDLGGSTLGAVAGTVTAAVGDPVAGATVFACPTAGQTCGRSTTTAANGTYSLDVPAGPTFVWAIAAGYQDEYYDGGHSASDPLTLPVDVVTGATTTADLTMDPEVAPTIRIDAGATAPFTDASRHTWTPDQYFSGGNTRTDAPRPIDGTADDELYFTQRFGTRKTSSTARNPFDYEIPVPNGTYTVTLRFAEVFFTQVGERVFSVNAEGQPIVTNLDIIAEVGPNTADDKTATVVVSDGALSLHFIPVVQAPMVQAIAVAPA